MAGARRYFFMKHLCLFSFFLLIAVSSAIGQETNRIEDTVLSGEDRDATRLGYEAFLSRFQGLYAIDGACDLHDQVWAFATESVTMGDVICLGLGKMTWEDDSLRIPLSQCTRDGEEMHERDINLREANGSDLTVTVDSERFTLSPCP